MSACTNYVLKDKENKISLVNILTNIYSDSHLQDIGTQIFLYIFLISIYFRL
jgi:hypothetical protein